ncbi:hypothetical protein [Palleronia caenipelagi]|uniref:Uncharacterized protein n=1 Tax=Palleronia caenipelagi TaxID=2489174 RepID=A0A547Q9E3_9RHOB|nr:hypothetical protein [Palleronia caenipelagi]TRD22984.1 hypothetical protein FEV53_02125 [Palleronia caenipelagi]
MDLETLIRLISQDGPWVLLVFYLLYREGQSDAATRQALDHNTKVLTEMTTLIRARIAVDHVL